MAHFAELDNNNIVKRVIVVSSKNFLNSDGVEDESIGKAFCRKLYGDDTRWVQTSFTGRIRARFATVGVKYDEELDLFYNPNPPYPSWTIHSSKLYFEPPIPEPEIPDGKTGYNEWDENLYVNDTSDPKTAGWVFFEETSE